jgi:H+/Cl- antiporter ClcA
MNFKPTIWKIIISFIISILIGIYGWINSYCLDCSSNMILKVKSEVFIKLFLFFIIVIYVSYSLFQKKK